MKYTVNGFAGFDENGFESYARRIEKLTDDFDKKLKKILKIEELEQDLLFLEVRIETLLGEIEALEKLFVEEYQIVLYLYKADCTITKTLCFLTKEEQEIGFDQANCQLRQLEAVVATAIDATILGNRLKVYFCLIVFLKPQLKPYFVLIFGRLETWPIYDGETLESQLIREISLVADPRLREVVSELLNELNPTLERRFRQFEQCAPFGSRQCVICTANFERTTLAPFPLESCENKNQKNFRAFFWSLFRKQLYGRLCIFLKGIHRA